MRGEYRRGLDHHVTRGFGVHPPALLNPAGRHPEARIEGLFAVDFFDDSAGVESEEGALLLGLEILVVADVIETITVRPTFESLAALGILVILRTILSWTLSLEAEGRWPWQPAEGS